MGVMECDRRDCENIMCNLYSSEFGYICYECFEELKKSNLDIATFMSKSKSELKGKRYDYDDVFEKVK